jgi:hypothetical protein
MSTEIALIAGSSIAGAISAAFIDTLLRVRSNNKKHARSSSPRTDIRAELLSLMFEKNLTAEAITRVYEAAQDGRIDRLERDKLLLKYKQQLDSLNQKVAYLQPVADFSVLDKKLLELSKSSPPSQDAIDAKTNNVLAETSKMQSVTPVEQKMFKADEKSIEQLQKEIVQALHHLEQVEIDKD